jgi:hypothetical protein
VTIEEADRRIALLRGLKASEANSRLRAIIQQELSWFLQYRAALAGEGPDSPEDVLERRQNYPIWMREATTFGALMESGAIVEDEAAGTVTLRWDLIADDQRDVALSWANEVVALYRGRTAGGRPKN